MHYAEQNVAATFDFAQKLMQAKDAAEVMGLQSEYLRRQMQALSAQVHELGQSAAKMVVDSTRPNPEICPQKVPERPAARRKSLAAPDNYEYFVQRNIFYCIAPKLCYIKATGKPQVAEVYCVRP